MDVKRKRVRKNQQGSEWNIISIMSYGAKLLVFLIILLPLGAGLVQQPIPQALDYSDGLSSIKDSIASGDFAEELSGLESVLEYSPWRGDLWQRAGRLYLDTGQLGRAISAFEQARSVQQLDAQGQVWLADALLSNGEIDEARQLLVSIEIQDSFILMQAASLLRQAGDLEGTTAALLKAYPLAPRNTELNYLLGIQLMAQHPDDALNYLEQAQSDPTRGASVGGLINTLEFYGDLAGSAEWYIYAGQALSQVEEWDVAAQSFEFAVVSYPENASAWALLGEAQQQLGKDGKPNLDKAVQLDPEGELTNGLMGLYFRRQGELEQALLFMQKALSANPQAAVWEIEMGDTLAETGKLEDALSHYRGAVEIDPSDWVSWRALAKFSVTRNYQVEEIGLDAASQALALYPDNPVLMDLLGTAYLVLGDLDSAERFFFQALEIDPEQAAILIHLGQLNLYRGDKDAAISYLRRASASASDDRLREMADRLLEEIGTR